MYNLALKLALLESGRPAYAIAAEAGMSETRLSRLVMGRIEAGLEEARCLSRLLGRPVSTLFPGVCITDAMEGEGVDRAGGGTDQ